MAKSIWAQRPQPGDIVTQRTGHWTDWGYRVEEGPALVIAVREEAGQIVCDLMRLSVDLRGYEFDPDSPPSDQNEKVERRCL